MSENFVDQNLGSNLDNSQVNAFVTAGQMLRQARTDAGLHIAALAVSLRVPVKRIEALESGQMDVLPDMVFVRALASSICQALKIDASPILDKLPKVASPRLNRDDIALNTPIAATGANKSIILSDIVTSPWFFGAVFLCIAAAVVYFWPNASSLAVSEIVTPVQSTTIPAVVSSATIPSASNALAPTSAAVLPARDTDAAKSNLVVNAVPPTDSIVVFKASAETWVEVKNAAGNTMFKKLLNAGETAGATGALPLTVIVGRADATQAIVRGKPIDLMSIAKSNVARFEVN